MQFFVNRKGVKMAREALKVPAERLRYVCNPKGFPFKDTSEVEPAKGFIGQERAVEALRFGLEIDNHEYNIFVTGNTGRGKKKDVLCEFVQEFAQEKAISGAVSPKDICYIFNFEKPNQPRVILFEKGGGRKFKKQMVAVFRSLIEAIRTKTKKDDLFKNLYEEYAACQKITDYLDGLKYHISNNIKLFQKGGEVDGEDLFLPFAVNLFVDNSARNAAPVIFEGSPDFNNLFCKIEKEFVMGSYFTNHTYLRAGSLALANGGYLIMNMSDILENFGVWQKLKKTLRRGILEIEESLPFNALNVASLNPESLPLNLKIVIVGEPDVYQLLVKHDPDFLSIFKVKVEFDSEMPLTSGNAKKYAGFISACCQKENLPPFDATGVAKIIEHGARLAESQILLSTKLDEIKDSIIEAGYWAKKSKMPRVQSKHVQKALEAQKIRLNLEEEKNLAMIKEGIILIDVRGEKIGQVNGLLVYNYGDYSFGAPSRITAKTFAGDKGLISIQREVKTSGPNHDTGVFTLNGYFREKYGKYRPISFSGSISFEQCYRGIEGDSASAAELFCLISSLSDLPISQSLAVTGSVNQNGEIQPIGGVNEKIEGFFNVCKKRGLSGKQGVIIPHQNIQDLMLKEDVVRACKKGKFRIYGIKSIDEGLEILTGVAAEDIYKKVKERLVEMAEKVKNKSA